MDIRVFEQLSEEEIKQRLRSLTKTEALILYWKLRDVKYRYIARIKVDVGVKMIHVHMTNVYAKLGFDPTMHHTKRREILDQIFLGPFLELCEGDPEFIKTEWPPDLPDPQPNEMQIVPVWQELATEWDDEAIFDDEMRRDLEVLHLDYPPVDYEIISRSSKKQSTRFSPQPGFWIALILIAFTAICFGIVLGVQPLLQGAISSILATETPTQTFSPTHTPTKSLTPSITQSPTNTAVPTKTNTPRPTYTPEPTLTLTSLPTPIPLPIVDDFNSYPGEMWEISGSDPYIIDGQLTTDKATTILIGNDAWRNYTIDMVYRIKDCDANNYIGFRAKDMHNSLGLQIGFTTFRLVTIENGTLTEIPGTDLRPYPGCDYDLNTQITILDDRVTVQHNRPANDLYGIEIVLSSELAKKYASGGVVLHFEKETLIDLIRITER